MVAKTSRPLSTASRSYDIILIGSGLGALTVASLMAQFRGKRVLVLERHFKPGGFTHSFQRKGFHWDVGVHYVGQMDEAAMPRQLFDLITQRGVQWQKMPEVFEKFVYPGLNLDVPSDPETYQAMLVEQFPHEAVAIAQYFRDLSRAMVAFTLHCLQKNANGAVRLILRLAQLWKGFDLSLTTQEYLDRCFTDEKLKALLVSQWLTYGVPPSQSPFALHAMIASHYLDGAYYPVGGAETIAQSIVPLIEAQGGKVLVSREVTEILMEEGRAIGVRVRNLRAHGNVNSEAHSDAQESYFAPVIISNAGAANTYLKLLPSDAPIPFRASLQHYMEHHHPATTVCLYVGFSEDPRQLGFRGENHWIYEQFDHEAIAHHTNQLLQGQPQQIYLSFPSLKNPTAQKHTAELLSQVDYSAFAAWKEQPWLHRDADYQALKERITAGLLETVDRHYPGFADLVDYAELSTPLTNEHFTAHPQGAIYGLPISFERLLPDNAAWTQAKTPIPGLYLTGVDLYMGGIVPALFSGVMTVSQLPDGLPLPAIFSQAVQQHAKAKKAKPQEQPCTGAKVAKAV